MTRSEESPLALRPHRTLRCFNTEAPDGLLRKRCLYKHVVQGNSSGRAFSCRLSQREQSLGSLQAQEDEPL